MAEWKKYDETTFTDFGSVGETMPAQDAGFAGGFDATMPADGGLAGGSFGAGSPFDATVPDTGTLEDGGNGGAAAADDPWGNQETVFDIPGVVNNAGVTVRPATGWLVCIEGVTKGTDYRLYQGYSYIGRDPAQNQVAIPDDHISSVPSARILYDQESRKFFINESNGARNPVYLNDQLFDGRVELKPYDIIRMGRTRLLFVPLCTDKFAWEE